MPQRDPVCSKTRPTVTPSDARSENTVSIKNWNRRLDNPHKIFFFFNSCRLFAVVARQKAILLNGVTILEVPFRVRGGLRCCVQLLRGRSESHKEKKKRRL